MTELTEQELQELEECEPKKIILKCKPTYNFQSIEFEWELDNDIDEMFEFYKIVVDGLREIAPAQPCERVSGEPATTKQLEILKLYNIPHKGNISKEDARKLIMKNMKK